MKVYLFLVLAFSCLVLSQTTDCEDPQQTDTWLSLNPGDNINIVLEQGEVQGYNVSGTKVIQSSSFNLSSTGLSNGVSVCIQILTGEDLLDCGCADRSTDSVTVKGANVDTAIVFSNIEKGNVVYTLDFISEAASHTPTPSATSAAVESEGPSSEPSETTVSEPSIDVSPSDSVTESEGPSSEPGETASSEPSTDVTPSDSEPSPAVSPSDSEPSPVVSPSDPVPSPVVSPSDPSPVVSPSDPVPSPVESPSDVASPGESPSDSSDVSIKNPSETPSDGAPSETPDDGTPWWVWAIIGIGIAILIIFVIGAAAFFYIKKKKRASFEQYGYEE